MSHDSLPQDPVLRHKYDRIIHDKYTGQQIVVDVYSVLEAFGEPEAPIAHAIKKLLCAGLRNKGTRLQDLEESIPSIQRVIDKERRSS